MRKLLLATVAVLGVSAGLADTGFAQSADDSSQGEAPVPGTIVVRLNGRVRVFGAIIADADANRSVFYNPSTGAAQEPILSPGGAGNIPAGSFGVRGPGASVVAAP